MKTVLHDLYITSAVASIEYFATRRFMKFTIYEVVYIKV